jgi:hypothetical protein
MWDRPLATGRPLAELQLTRKAPHTFPVCGAFAYPPPPPAPAVVQEPGTVVQEPGTVVQEVGEICGVGGGGRSRSRGRWEAPRLFRSCITDRRSCITDRRSCTTDRGPCITGWAAGERGELGWMTRPCKHGRHARDARGIRREGRNPRNVLLVRPHREERRGQGPAPSSGRTKPHQNNVERQRLRADLPKEASRFDRQPGEGSG